MSGLNVRKGNGTYKLAEGAIGYMNISSNDVQNNNATFFLSDVSTHAKGTSITPEHFDKIMVQAAVRKAIDPTWLNDRDQYTVPHTELPQEFVVDCTIFNLFSGHNQSSEWTAEYEGKKWKIKNEFFPFSVGFLEDVGPEDPAFERNRPRKETFVYEWLVANKEHVSLEAREVLAAGEDFYREFYANWNNVNRAMWKIEGCRPGWYQVRNAMREYGDNPVDVKPLKAKVAKGVYEYGFLEPEMLLEDIDINA